MQKNIIQNHNILETEADYIEFERLSKKLKIPVPTMQIIVTAKKDDKITAQFKGRSHTWNRNFWNFALAGQAYLPFVETNFGAGYISGKRTSAAVSALTAAQINALNLGPINNPNYGILAGRGDGAENFEGYVLTTPIIHGTSANQLSHRAQDATLQNYTAGTKTWAITLRRLFDNLSGNTITVTEAGIILYTTAYGYYIMICRDLLGTSVNVLNNGVLSITYVLSMTFPS